MTAILLTLLVSALYCGVYLKLAHRWQVLDHPNERSSHQRPTPHGGGLPMMLAFLSGLACAALLGTQWSPVYLSLAAGAVFLMLLGLLDDLRSLAVRSRLALYSLVCVSSVVLLLDPFAVASPMILGLAVIAAFGLLWMLNLYNFMDGIDGIAGVQCFLACCSVALLSWLGGGDVQYALFCLLLAAAHVGFLVWNWPPARLFMGDAGSVPTGYLLGALALAGAVGGQLNLGAWLILLAAFITDTSYTLIKRMLTGQPFTSPHREHAYQRLSRQWGGHLPVDLAVIALNGLWLFPLAWTSTLWPKFSILLVILAYLPLLAGMAKVHKLG
jgi:glycosyltransferase WbpL